MQSIFLKGYKYLLKGEIHIDPASLMEGHKLLDNILVDILDRDHRIVGQDIARVVLDDNDVTSRSVYNYSYWANLGDELIFVPQDLRYSILSLLVVCGGLVRRIYFFSCWNNFLF